MDLFNSPPTGSAVLSECGTYRYLLKRTWNAKKQPVVFIMLNPSKADATGDDPTVRRCVGFAKAWGYGGIVVVNLYAYRATDPRELEAQAILIDGPYGMLHAIGPETDVHISAALQHAGVVVAAWGATPVHGIEERVKTIRKLVLESGNRLMCLSTTQGGHPGHPLYQPSSRQLQSYS